jgi:hypothetical protein
MDNHAHQVPDVEPRSGRGSAQGPAWTCEARHGCCIRSTDDPRASVHHGRHRAPEEEPMTLCGTEPGQWVRRLCAVMGGVALLAGCAAAVHPAPTPTYDAVAADLVMLTLVDVRTVPASTVLDDRSDVIGFAGRLAAHDEQAAEEFREQIDGHDFGTTAFLAFISGVGCGNPDRAELRRARDGADFTVRYPDMEVPENQARPNCAVPWNSLVVFALPREQLPSDIRLGGSRPDPAGLGELVEFVQVDVGWPAPGVVAAEVSQPDQEQRFLAQFPDGLRSHVGELDRPYEGRLFAFSLNACPDEQAAVLVVEPERMSAVAAGDGLEACEPTDLYVAVFAIDAGAVPPRARIATS